MAQRKKGNRHMNPVLIFLILIGAALLWLICSFLYKPIGRFFNRLISDAKEAMFEEKENTNDKGEE
jgi:hypothetical protein